MVTHSQGWKLRLVVAGIMLSAVPAFADDSEGVVRIRQVSASEGVVRISDRETDQQVLRGQSPTADPNVSYTMAPQGDGWTEGYSLPAYSGNPADAVYGDGYEGVYCPEGGFCPPGGPGGPPVCQYCPEFLGHGPLAAWLRMNATAYRSRNQVASQLLKQSIYRDLVDKGRWLRCKFGYLVPTGGCGQGVPLAGKYGMVYPVDPNYFDARDGQVYAAQGYHGPVAVPLAPVVNHQYNYGWGVPSSRLTPILHDNGNYPVQGAPVNAAPIAQ